MSEKKIIIVLILISAMFVFLSFSLNVYAIALSNTQFDRYKALEYMGEYTIDPNPAYETLPADCTNFASQVLYAGGMEEVRVNGGIYDNDYNWYYESNYIPVLRPRCNTWVGAMSFQRHWAKDKNGFGFERGYNHFTLTVNECIQYYTDLCLELAPGDIIQTIDDDGYPGHTMVVYWITFFGGVEGDFIADITYSQHTNNKYASLIDYLAMKYNNQEGNSKVHFIKVFEN